MESTARAAKAAAYDTSARRLSEIPSGPWRSLWRRPRETCSRRLTWPDCWRRQWRRGHPAI